MPADATVTMYSDAARTVQLENQETIHGDRVYAHVEWSEPVSSFPTSAIVVSGLCTLEAFTEVTTTVYTFEVVVSSMHSSGSCSFLVNQEHVTDMNGQTGTGTIELDFKFEGHGQMVHVTSADGQDHGIVRMPPNFSVTPSPRNVHVTHTEEATKINYHSALDTKDTRDTPAHRDECSGTSSHIP